jgi:enamine deaminase RidA (YjgF/YER057c/UK114 family)
LSATDNLTRLGLALPTPPAAVGNYEAWVRSGDLIVTSGQLPWLDGVMQHPGRLGDEVTPEQGYEAARLAALNGIAQLGEASGDLERVERVLRVEGSVHCAPGFRGHPEVLDGASDLLVAVFGDRGRHTRSALGIADMPRDACVQVSLWARLRA